jgi:voltage-gated potassium channel
LKNHIVICGWSSKAGEIIREIRGRDEEGKRAPIVVLAPLPASPTKDELTTFIAGDPTLTRDLERAGIDQAQVAIVLADNSYPGIDAEEMDSRTLITVLAIESLNPSCYTCVEVIHSDNREHFNRTKADELVVSAHLTGALLAHSAMARGLSRIVDDLLTYPEGDEFYWVEVPAAWAGTAFQDAMTRLKQGFDCLPLAVSRDGGYTTNPKADYVLATGDRLLVLAKQEPVIT